MKRVLLIPLLLWAVNAYAGFSFYRTITVNHPKVPSNQTDFAILVSFTDATLKTVANGGHVNNANGYDIGFYSDSSASTKLKWEMERYTATTGEVVAWVKIASLSSSVDNVIYCFYGDATISTDQSDKVNVWDGNYKAIWHMADNAASTTILESTSTGANATNIANTNTKTATGNVDGSLSYNGTADAASVALDLSATNIITLSFWMNWTTNANDDDLAFEYTVNYNLNPGFIADWNDAGGNFGVGFVNSGSRWSDTFPRPSAGSWHLIELVYDRGTPINKAYVDGAAQTMTTSTHNAVAYFNFANASLYFMSRATTSLHGAGTLDEVRVSTVERTQDWITTEYNNQSNPATFETLGSEVSLGSTRGFFLFFP